MIKYKFRNNRNIIGIKLIAINRLKIILFLLFVSISINLFSQDYDVRKTKWGMSIKEVKKSEKPLEGEVLTSGRSFELLYEEVPIQGYYTNIYYNFSNKKLNRISYTYFTSDKPSSLYSRTNKLIFFFRTLKNKNFKPYKEGWHVKPFHTGSKPKRNDKFNNCKSNRLSKKEYISLDKRVINEIYYCAYMNNIEKVTISFADNRTEVDLILPISEEYTQKQPYYNKYILGQVIFRPTIEINDDNAF